MTLPCVRCGKQLLPVTRDDDELDNQPHGGTTFTSHGQYGSTVWDEITGRYLEINVCDQCMLELAAAGHILVVTEWPRPDAFKEPWQPEHEWCERCGAVWPPHDRHLDEPPF